MKKQYLSVKTMIAEESKGLIILFGNRLITKYRQNYIDKLKQQHGDLDYLKYLEDDSSISDDLKYTQVYLEKSEKRNRAVLKYREKKKNNQSIYFNEYERLLKENYQLQVIADSLEKDFFELVSKLKFIPKELTDIIENIQNK
jgi:hypothetical protein